MRIIIHKGGEGSGNFGHAGRPGLVGGSASARGSSSDNPLPQFREGVDISSDTKHAVQDAGYLLTSVQNPSLGTTTKLFNVDKDTRAMLRVYPGMIVAAVYDADNKKKGDYYIRSTLLPVKSSMISAIKNGYLFDIESHMYDPHWDWRESGYRSRGEAAAMRGDT